MVPKKNRDWMVPAGAWLGVLILVSIGLWIVHPREHTPQTALQESSASGQRDAKLVVYSPETKRVESRTVKIPKDREISNQIKILLEALCAKPASTHAATLWPMALPVRSVYQLKNGTLILDFENEVKYNHDADAFTEWLAVQAIVQTVLKNFKEISRVKILIGGMETDTLAGHVDISRPFNAETVSW